MERFLKYFAEKTTSKSLIEQLGRSQALSALNALRKDGHIRIVGDQWELTEAGTKAWQRYCGLKP